MDGQPAATGDPSRALERGVATIYQERDLVEDLTVAQSIYLGHERGAGTPGPRADAAETVEILRRLNHEAISPRTYVRDLRPAGQQVVSIARALSRHVRLLIMDEPSAILDDSEIETMFEVVRRLTAEGVGDLHLAPARRDPRLGDRVTVLTDGGRSPLACRRPRPRPARGVMVGRKVGQLYPERRPGNGTVVLEVRRLPDVKHASFEVRSGEVLGIGGLVGAGRSEPPGHLRRRRPRCRRGAGGRPTCAAGPARPCDAAAWAWRPRIESRRPSCSTGT